MDYYNIYLPTQYDYSNFIYRLTDDNTIQIITNNNCVTGYNNTNCDCYDYYINRGVSSSSYSCSRNQTTRILSRSDFKFDDTMAKYQSTLYSWGNLILVIGVIWSICFFLMKSK